QVLAKNPTPATGPGGPQAAPPAAPVYAPPAVDDEWSRQPPRDASPAGPPPPEAPSADPGQSDEKREP
ncbi:MAG: hypothetical protein WED87_02155, partial [Dehalococcoidia bacterium]